MTEQEPGLRATEQVTELTATQKAELETEPMAGHLTELKAV